MVLYYHEKMFDTYYKGIPRTYIKGVMKKYPPPKDY